jgi:hypothetical protein
MILTSLTEKISYINSGFVSFRQRSRLSNEAPRRKRTGYQSGLKPDLYFGGHVVSPQTPLPRIYPTASGWGIHKVIINNHAQRKWY